MEAVRGDRGFHGDDVGVSIYRIVTLLGARLLGARVATAHSAAPARWFDQRRNESMWREISVGPSGRGSFEESWRRGMELGQQLKQSTNKAQEETHMHKVNGIGKFLQLGGVVQGGARGPRWFSLPGSWHAPRIQIMRRHEPSPSAAIDERRTARMLSAAVEQGRW